MYCSLGTSTEPKPDLIPKIEPLVSLRGSIYESNRLKIVDHLFLLMYLFLVFFRISHVVSSFFIYLALAFPTFGAPKEPLYKVPSPFSEKDFLFVNDKDLLSSSNISVENQDKFAPMLGFPQSYPNRSAYLYFEGLSAVIHFRKDEKVFNNYSLRINYGTIKNWLKTPFPRKMTSWFTSAAAYKTTVTTFLGKWEKFPSLNSQDDRISGAGSSHQNFPVDIQEDAWKELEIDERNSHELKAPIGEAYSFVKSKPNLESVKRYLFVKGVVDCVVVAIWLPEQKKSVLAHINHGVFFRQNNVEIENKLNDQLKLSGLTLPIPKAAGAISRIITQIPSDFSQFIGEYFERNGFAVRKYQPAHSKVRHFYLDGALNSQEDFQSWPNLKVDALVDSSIPIEILLDAYTGRVRVLRERNIVENIQTQKETNFRSFPRLRELN